MGHVLTEHQRSGYLKDLSSRGALRSGRPADTELLVKGTKRGKPTPLLGHKV